jgi:hypothetical protein
MEKLAQGTDNPKAPRAGKGRPAGVSTPKSRRLEIKAQPGVTEDRLVTDLVADGEVTNASTALRFVTAEHGELSLTDMVASLREHGEAVNRGDLAAAERMLNAQAVALNTIFGELARRAALNMGTYMGATESYLRLALKAQSQSRATIETLAAIKNPPTVFARQANIAHGPQQVNNGAEPPRADHYAPGCAGETHSAPTELLEDPMHGRTQLDPATAPATSRAHSHLAPMAAIDRPAHR